MAGTIYLNPTKKQKKKKDYVAPGETTKFTKTTKKKKKGKGRRKTPKEEIKKSTTTQPKETIQLNEPTKPKEEIVAPNEEGVIDLTQQGQPEETLARKLGTAGIVGAGVALGTGAFLAGGALLGLSAAGKTAIGAKSVIGLSKLSGKASNIIPGKFVTIPKVASFAANAKTAGLSTSMWVKAGLAVGAASLTIGIIGSYPFAGFIKEESLQTLSFGTKVAMDSGDLEGAQEAIDQVNEILNPSAWDKIFASIPFANVLSNLQEFYEAAALKNANDQEALDKAKKISSGEQESDFAKNRRVSDEAARERELGYRAEDEEFFQGVREENEQREREREEEEEDKFARIDEERKARDEEERVADETESARFEEIRERNKQEDLDDLKFKSKYFDLIREKKFAEAAELLASQ